MILSKEDRNIIEFFTCRHLTNTYEVNELYPYDLEQISTEHLVKLYRGTERIINDINEKVQVTGNSLLMLSAVDYISTKTLFQSTIKERLYGANIELAQ